MSVNYRALANDKEVRNAFRIVENSIRKSRSYPTEVQLWYSLRHRIPRLTLKKILIRLEKDNKIIRDRKDGSIIWTFVDTPEARQSLRDSIPLR
jgi:hypothetical protein